MHDQRCMQAPILTLIVWGLVGCLEVEVLKPLKGAGASFFIETAHNCGALSYLDYIHTYIHTIPTNFLEQSSYNGTTPEGGQCTYLRQYIHLSSHSNSSQAVIVSNTPPRRYTKGKRRQNWNKYITYQLCSVDPASCLNPRSRRAQARDDVTMFGNVLDERQACGGVSWFSLFSTC
ncbi:hypothetical protein P167DRAFT_58882 [Morchella conica CCBAS932]|uniref:Uncharacterized protein n=1 Tax=Morchella conica CCBAS932 TaxID=1392247 RepID=A0A3N4KYU4_9PEZI|nr:hypothetical protein P167DRAFT_58882 [Morchella conica CCBAS932]